MKDKITNESYDQLLKEGDVIYCHTTLLMNSGTYVGQAAFSFGKLYRVKNSEIGKIHMIDDLNQYHGISHKNFEKWFDLLKIIRKHKLEKLRIIDDLYVGINQIENIKI